LFFYHIFDLVCLFLFVFVKLETCALNVSIPYLACFSFLDFAHEGLAELDEVFRRTGVSHLQCFDKIYRVLFFLRSDESDGCSSVSSSTGSADSMDVVFEMVGAFEVDN
jgi:hypothetical protein